MQNLWVTLPGNIYIILPLLKDIYTVLAETFGPEHRPIVEFAIDNVQTLKIRKAKQHFHHQQNDDSETVDANGSNNAQSRKQKSISEDRTLKDSKLTEEEIVDTGVCDETPIKKRGPKKKQKTDLSSKKPEVSFTNNAEDKSKGPKQKSKRRQDGKGKTKANESQKSISFKETDTQLGKRKLQDQKDQEDKSTKYKRPKKNKDPVERDVVDKLDLLIEKYRTKFTQRSSNKSDSDKQGSKQLRRWFQS